MTSHASNFGIVYLLVNECMPGIVKIGKTSRANLKARMRELFTTGVPIPFECAYACAVASDHLDYVERAFHQAFAPNRVHPGREFFRISPEQAIPIMKVLNKLSDEDATSEVQTAINSVLKTEDVTALEKLKKSRRPSLDFFQLGLQKGDLLVFSSSPTVHAAVHDARKVEYDGVVQSLTAATRTILGKPKDYALQPTPYWEVNGKSLTEMYNSKYPPIDDEQ